MYALPICWKIVSANSVRLSLLSGELDLDIKERVFCHLDLSEDPCSARRICQESGEMLCGFGNEGTTQQQLETMGRPFLVDVSSLQRLMFDLQNRLVTSPYSSERQLRRQAPLRGTCFGNYDWSSSSSSFYGSIQLLGLTRPTIWSIFDSSLTSRAFASSWPKEEIAARGLGCLACITFRKLQSSSNLGESWLNRITDCKRFENTLRSRKEDRRNSGDDYLVS